MHQVPAKRGRTLQDVLVLMQESCVPMSFLRCIPIGVMQMIDQGEQDDKVRLCMSCARPVQP